MNDYNKIKTNSVSWHQTFSPTQFELVPSAAGKSAAESPSPPANSH